jgi:hypothetical protein
MIKYPRSASSPIAPYWRKLLGTSWDDINPANEWGDPDPEDYYGDDYYDRLQDLDKNGRSSHTEEDERLPAGGTDSKTSLT